MRNCICNITFYTDKISNPVVDEIIFFTFINPNLGVNGEVIPLLPTVGFPLRTQK